MGNEISKNNTGSPAKPESILDYEFKNIMQESRELFDRLKPIADNLSDAKEKIFFWQNELRKWKNNISLRTKKSSGEVLAYTKLDEPLYFEKMVLDEITLIKENSSLFAAKPTKPPKIEKEQPQTFEELFYNPANAEPCLRILGEIEPPVIDAMNNYIGKGKKGIFPLWVRLLQKEALMKPTNDKIIKDLLNQKITGLNLSKDASEFRTYYARIEQNKIAIEIKTILSQFSQSGKLGK
jgi:hypothetical protein